MANEDFKDNNSFIYDECQKVLKENESSLQLATAVRLIKYLPVSNVGLPDNFK